MLVTKDSTNDSRPSEEGVGASDNKDRVFKSLELEKLYGSRQAVRRALATGKLHQVCRGVYSMEKLSKDVAIIETYVKYYSDAVISKQSALILQGLVKDKRDKLDLDVPREDNPPRSHELFKFNRRANIIGVEDKILDGRKMLIYSRERCLFEALQLEGKLSRYFREAVMRYCASGKIDLEEIERLGESIKGASDILFSIQTVLAVKNL